MQMEPEEKPQLRSRTPPRNCPFQPWGLTGTGEEGKKSFFFSLSCSMCLFRRCRGCWQLTGSSVLVARLDLIRSGLSDHQIIPSSPPTGHQSWHLLVA